MQVSKDVLIIDFVINQYKSMKKKKKSTKPIILIIAASQHDC